MSQHIRSAFLKHFRDNGSIYIFTMILFLMGVIFGAIIVNSLSYPQKDDLFMYLSRFFGQMADGQVADSGLMFKQSFLHYTKYVGLMWILGLSIIGLPVILVLLFLKGVVVGFTVGFLVNQMGWYGFLLSFVSVMPQNILLIPAFILISVASILFSMKMIREQILKKVHEPFFPQFTRYTMVMVGIFMLIGVSTAFEAYVSPFMMKSVIHIIYN